MLLQADAVKDAIRYRAHCLGVKVTDKQIEALAQDPEYRALVLRNLRAIY